MKIINIKGFESHLFKEGDEVIVNFSNINRRIKKSPNSFLKRNASSKINIGIDVIKTLKEEKEFILDQKDKDLNREDKGYKILPFVDKEEAYVLRDKSKTNFKKNYGTYDGNELYLEIDNEPFQDRSKVNIREFVNLAANEIDNYIYPITFNSDSYHRSGGRIDVFSIISNLTLSSSYVDKLRGFRGYSINNGTNFLDENIKVENKFTKKKCKSFPFEDGILEGFIYNEQGKKVLDNITYDYDPITKTTSNITSTFKLVNKISNEPGFTTFNAQKIKPYVDIDNKKNNPDIVNDSQIFLNKLTSDSLNDILLSNKSSYNVIEESTLYASLGKSIDYSINQGVESIFYHESVD